MAITIWSEKTRHAMDGVSAAHRLFTPGLSTMTLSGVVPTFNLGAGHSTPHVAVQRSRCVVILT